MWFLKKEWKELQETARHESDGYWICKEHNVQVMMTHAARSVCMAHGNKELMVVSFIHCPLCTHDFKVPSSDDIEIHDDDLVEAFKP